MLWTLLNGSENFLDVRVQYFTYVDNFQTSWIYIYIYIILNGMLSP